MVTLLDSITNYYNDYFIERRDGRSAHLPLVGSPVLIVGIVFAYLYFVLRYGPRHMVNRKPYNVLKMIKVYNLFQMAANVTLFLRICYNVFLLYEHFSFRCQPIDYSKSRVGMDEVYFSYAYFLLKLADLADTVFFVLRKKQSHVSFLHVYHHSFMVLTTYCALVFVPGGHVLLLGLWNTLVHAIMYFYYFLTSLGAHNNSIWWKKYLTRLQLMQFLHLAFHFGRPLFDGNCNFPTFWLWYGFLQAIIVLGLFLDFYIKTYKYQDKNELAQKKA
ncbi:elongation of very long chain fatty acids protein AAEL008004-like isoform X2 [Anopheles stephensi]|uniref:elongation of very long chain fatty acids protein AAEL008004-like isoform X2 n=1 Tax=Anopheles stephensi TaxID=30069 RepID=UPI0007D18DFA|nr:elongation of very long chain fatty acids protein AAEL008004-like isoform X2 [Anopheles stephensi]XP_035918997.1 elongation of very long chain fatty acids protein AAEL008004-like isoform X2 [Anopheles stephensi]